jgi:hypothetical protein
MQDGRALDRDVAPSASALYVHVTAKDADDLNVTATRADLNLQWGNLSVEFQRHMHGSNEYTALLHADLKSAHERILIVTLRGGWSRSGGENGSCLLLRQTIHLPAAPDSNLQYYVLAGSLVACAIIIGSLLFLIRRHTNNLQHIFRTLITEVAVLVCTLIFETADMATDIYTWYRAVVDDSLGAGDATKTAYSAILGLASLVSCLAVVYHLRLARLLRQAATAHVSEATAVATPRSADKARLTKLKWEVDRSRREMTAHAITLLSVLLEDVSYAVPTLHQAAVFALACAPGSARSRFAGAQVPFMVLNCSVLFTSGMPDRMERACKLW